MCGIFGVWQHGENNRPIDRDLVKTATRVINYRGPDSEGYYFSPENRLALGQRRLSIIDLATGDQPMANEDDSIWIIFNGEIYNYHELREQLVQSGHTFKTKSDTEVIIHGYEQYGDEVAAKLNGIFAFAIWDSKKQKLLLARDHFGVKPLYYYDNGSELVFASEIKAILAYSQIAKKLNVQSLALTLKYRHSPAPITMFEDVKKLSAASLLVSVSGKSPIIKDYWKPDLSIDNYSRMETLTEELEQLLIAAIKRQMIADVPVGISLSGGLDSGVILSLMSQFEGKGIHAFSVGFEGNKEEDQEILRARLNASRFGAQFHYMNITESDYTEFFEKYIWHLEEPIGNESAAAYYFVAKMAKGIVKVLLNGQGADEPFLGYDRYIGMYWSDIVPRHLLKPFLSLMRISSLSLSRKVQFNRLSEYLQYDSTYDKITSVASILGHQQLSDLMQPDVMSYLDGDFERQSLQKYIDLCPNGKLVEKMSVFDMFTSLSENLLLCEDKMAMAASIEARVPFLDVHLAEAALRVPAKYKIQKLSGKLIHKKVSEKFLPKEVVYQKKVGFNNPIFFWLQSTFGERLLDYAHSSNSITKQFLNMHTVERLFKEHKTNSMNHEKLLFLLLSIEEWNAVFLK